MRKAAGLAFVLVAALAGGPALPHRIVEPAWQAWQGSWVARCGRGMQRRRRGGGGDDRD